MNDIERLLAIEEIKCLKARYFYAFDHKDWAMWRGQVFAPDGRLEVPEAGFEVEGVDAMVDWISAQAADQVSVHHGHMPIIEILSDTTAKGVWAMEDRLYRSTAHPLGEDVSYLHGFGHYHETYVKLDCGWRIQSTRLTRIRVESVRVN
jgi:SnoaL-like domain